MTDANRRANGKASWEPIVRHYESCLAQHGANPKGVDWPNGIARAARFSIMLELIEGIERPALLDVGCGPGLLVDYLTATGAIDRVDYEGVDLSEAMIA